MKKLIMIAILVFTTVFFAGCKNSAEKPTEETTKATEPVTTQPETTSAQVFTDVPSTEEPTTEEPSTEEPTTEEPDDTSEIFGELSNKFIFSSGAGAWATVLNINPDGSFDGNFHDSNMGETGEGYPGGTIYYCDFTGQFGDVEKVNDYTYSMKMLSIEYKNDPDTEEIKEQRKFIYATAYGLDEAEELYIYIPDAPISELPEKFLMWAHKPGSTDSTLGSYGIYNLNEEEGFIEHSN